MNKIKVRAVFETDNLKAFAEIRENLDFARQNETLSYHIFCLRTENASEKNGKLFKVFVSAKCRTLTEVIEDFQNLSRDNDSKLYFTATDEVELFITNDSEGKYFFTYFFDYSLPSKSGRGSTNSINYICDIITNELENSDYHNPDTDYDNYSYQSLLEEITLLCKRESCYENQYFFYVKEYVFVNDFLEEITE